MKTVFVVPPALKEVPERMYGCSYTIYQTPNLAILYSAAVLEKESNQVKIIDFSGKKWKDFYKEIDREEADFYIFHSVLLSTKIDLEAAKFILDKKPKSRIVFFGPHPTYMPKTFLISERCIVARGEPEFIIRDIVKGKLLYDIKGISYIENDRIKENETAGIIKNIDELPFPARHLDKELYFNPKLKEKRFTNIITSRGCVYRCYFCVPNSISWAREIEYKRFFGAKPPVTLRSAKNIIKEISELKRQSITQISFVDDQFVWNKKRMLEVCKGIEKLNVEFGILARADHLTDEEIVSSLSRAGCKYADIGVESFDQKILDDIRKDMKVSEIYRAIELLNKHSIKPKINIVFGCSPLESKNSIDKTIRLLKKLPVEYAMFSICTPFPGTDFEKIARKSKWYRGNNDIYANLDPAKKSLISYPGLAKRDLEKSVRKANREFYLRPRLIIKQMAKNPSLLYLPKKVKSVIRLLK